MNTMLKLLSVNCTKKIIRLIFALAILSQNASFGQAAVYTAEPFNTNIPGYPNWTAGASFKTPTVDWTQANITGGGLAPNDFQWVNAGINPAAANQNIAGFPAGAGFMRYVNRTVAYPAISGAPNGDAAFVATRSLDWSGHTTYNAVTDTFGISVWRDNTAAALAVLDYIEVYVNTQPSLNGAVLASTTGGANKIHRSTTQAPIAPVGWNRYQFVIPNDARFYGPLFPGACGTSSAYIIIAGYSAGGNNIFIDNINMPQWQTQMVVTAANVFITQNADVGKNSLDNVMLGVQITTKGSITPRRLDGIAFNTVGSTAFSTDVTQPSGPKCWFTGGSSSFATTGGSVSVPKVNPSSPSYTNAQLHFGFLDGVAGCPTGLTTALYNFTPGNENFVWLAYDITATAQTGNFVAGGFEHLYTGRSAPGVAGCFGDTVITSAGVQVPANFAAFVPSPSISAIRPIAVQAYNIPTYTSGTSRPGGGYYNNDFISGVFFPGDNSTKIDNYNHDVSCSSCIAVGGQNCQRFDCHPADYTLFDPINMGIYKERFVQVTQGKGVRTGTPPYAVKAQCGTWFSANTVAIFIDWNKDGDFDDSYNGIGGLIYENYGSQQQTQASMALPAVWGPNTSWNINVPSPADVVVDANDANQLPNNSTGPIIVGNVRMRVREIYAAANNFPFNGTHTQGVHPTASGFTYGEVEDYTIQVLPDCPMPGSNVCKWVGATNDWNNPSNWCPALPTKNDIAFIPPGPLFSPTILDNTIAECRTLQIMPGAKLEINAAVGSSLKVYDDVIIGEGATLGTGSSIAITSEVNKTMTIPAKTQVPPAGLTLATVTPFRTNAQTKTQIAYTAAELANTYGWKAGDVIESICIEVNGISGGAGPSTYSGLRIMAYLRNAPVTYPFPAPANTKIACMPGDAQNVAGWPKVIFGPGSTTLNMPMATAGTQAGGNYATFNLIPGVLVWDGVSNLVISFENWTALGLPPAKNYILYNESSPTFNVCAINAPAVTAGAINGQNICGPNTYYNPGLIVGGGATAVVSNQRPRLDFKLKRPYKQFPITVGGDWINNNRNVRTAVYSTTPLYNIVGDSGFIAGNSRVIFDPTGRNTVNSVGLNVANPSYYTGIPGALLPADIDQDITSAVTNGGNSTVFGALEIKKTSATAKSVRQVSTFSPYLNGHYADSLILTNGELNLNRKIFTLRQSGATALTRTNGWIRSEDFAGASPGNIQSKFDWIIGTGTTGVYSVPFKATTTGVFRFIYNKTVAADNVGSLTVGTYGTTASNNTPYPNSLLTVPNAVLAMNTNPSPVLDATPWTVDRFWLVGRSTATTLTGGTITFEYDNAEGTTTANYVSGEMKAQRHELSGSNTGWAAPYAGQTDAVVAGNVRSVTHPASYIDQSFTVWTVVRTNPAQRPLGGIACVATQPVITPNGPLTFCNGSVTLTCSNAATYDWSNGASTQSITVSASGSYVVTITDGSGCVGVSTPTVVNASIVVLIITANGSTTFCQNDSLLLTSTTAATYTWSTGATTQNIYVKTSGTYYVVVANANGCTALSNSITATVNTLPTANITAGGPTTFCLGDSVELKCSTNANYLWSTGATTKKIYAKSTGAYVVTVTKLNGCSKTSAPVNVNVSNSTPPNISANGPTTFCLGGSVILTCSVAPSYTWSTGATTQSITVSSSGAYFVITGSLSGCSSQSATINVTVNQLVTPVISATGPLTFCPGQNVILTSTAASTYLWSTGATTQSIAVSTPASYVVTITDGSGCSAASAPAVVVVTCPKPSALSTSNITSSSAKLNWGVVSCAIGYKVQYRVNGTTTWTTSNVTTIFKNTVGLQNSTTYQWRVATKCPNGSFSTYTAIQSFTTLVIRADELAGSNTENDFSLFPNPSTGTFTLQFNSIENGNAEIKIYNTLGELMFNKTFLVLDGENNNVFNIEHISPGIYFVDLKTSSGIKRSKLIKH